MGCETSKNTGKAGKHLLESNGGYTGEAGKHLLESYGGMATFMSYLTQLEQTQL